MNLHPRIRHIAGTKGVTIALVTAGSIMVALLIFHAGVVTGQRQEFARMHMGRLPPPPPGFLPHGFMPDGHGAVGTIIKLALPLVTMQTRDGRESVIRIASSTEVRDITGNTSTDKLTTGESIIVIGEPDEQTPGDIEARLIRIISPK
jgi:hypothetical protein